MRTTALIYVRKSLVKSSGIDPASPELQEQECRALALKNHWQVEVFSDAHGHRSGKTDKRPGYQALLARAHQPDVAAILVHKYSRIARNTRLLLQLVDTLTKLDVQLISVTNAIDASTAQGRMMLTIVSSFDEMYSNEMSDTRKEQIDFLRREKGRHYGLAPFGAVRAEQNGELVLVPSSAPQPNGTDHDALMQCYQLYAVEHLSYRVIAVRLNTEGWQYRDRHGQLRAWTTDDVRRAIAAHWLYAGYVTIGRAYRNLKEVIPGSHSAILPPALTTLAATRLKKTEGQRGKGKLPAAFYPLTGLISCQECQANLRGQTVGAHRYYLHPLPVTHKASWPADPIEQSVRERIAALKFPDEYKQRSSAVVTQKLLAQANAPKTQAVASHVQTALDRLNELYTEGFITRVIYDARRAEYLAQLPADVPLPSIEPALYKIPPTDELIKNCSPAVLREITRVLYQRITITPTRPTIITYTPYPYAPFA